MPLFQLAGSAAQLPARQLPAKLAAVLHAAQARTIDLFRILDSNADGVVTRKELATALGKLGAWRGHIPSEHRWN